MKLLRIGAAALLSLAVFGCGDSESEEPKDPPKGTINTAVAGQTATSTFQAVSGVGTDGQASAFTIASAAAGAFAIIGPDTGAQPQSTGTAQQALGEGTCDCTANSCTFTDCGDASGFTITGSFSWTDSSLDADYTVGGTVQGNTYNYSVQAALTFTPTSLDGTLSMMGDFEIMGGGQTVNTSFDVSVVYNSVTFPMGGGSPTGGSMEVTASANYGGASYGNSATVTFPI